MWLMFWNKDRQNAVIVVNNFTIYIQIERKRSLSEMPPHFENVATLRNEILVIFIMYKDMDSDIY